MPSSPIQQLESLVVGTIESVSPRKIVVQLGVDAPYGTALNTGIPQPFPQINGYVLVPIGGSQIVGLIEWVGVEPSLFPKRKGLQDFGVVDLPFPQRKMVVNPVGRLLRVDSGVGVEPVFELYRGLTTFPSIGDKVVLPTVAEQRAIVEAHGPDSRVVIGRAPLAANARVSADPNKIFGRHLAVLGNTGSGKSCSVAGLIRWSLEAATTARESSGRQGLPKSRFIVLDPNGEYAHAFADFEERVRLFQVPPVGKGGQALRLPAWLWNSHEWSSFSAASAATQRPILLQALRELRGGATSDVSPGAGASRRLRSAAWIIQDLEAKGSAGYTTYPANKDCGTLFECLREDVERYAGLVDEPRDRQLLEELEREIAAVVAKRKWESQTKTGFNNFSETDLVSVRERVQRAAAAIQSEASDHTAREDAPIPFSLDLLPEHLEQLAGQHAGGQVSQWVAFLAMRVRMMLSDERLRPIVKPEEEPSLEGWLTDHLGSDEDNSSEIVIIDLSLVPSDVLHTVITVVARLVFEAIQRVRKVEQVELPTVLVLEEAHNFIHRGSSARPEIPGPATMCRETFERIAREGRKFGLGLVLSSQRPSELSSTALAQCNTFLLHRLVNDRDQDLVRRLVPDSLSGLLEELPNLPTRTAVFLGWGTPLPIMVEMRELPREHRPSSEDPKFWESWIGEEKISFRWRDVVEDWVR